MMPVEAAEAGAGKVVQVVVVREVAAALVVGPAVAGRATGRWVAAAENTAKEWFALAAGTTMEWFVSAAGSSTE
jgi:hypothetical protein